MEKLYDVYINSRLTATAVNEKEAWKVIGEQRFGSCHMVYLTGTKEIAEQFVPY